MCVLRILKWNLILFVLGPMQLLHTSVVWIRANYVALCNRFEFELEWISGSQTPLKAELATMLFMVKLTGFTVISNMLENLNCKWFSITEKRQDKIPHIYREEIHAALSPPAIM
jgi:hypothetical protein